MPLTQGIARPRTAPYSTAMAWPLYRLLALLAVLLMPLSMAAAPATAQPVQATVGHCTDHEQQPTDTRDQAKMHCAACAALPALNPSAAVAQIMPQPPLHSAMTENLSGIILEIATPPPKRS